MTIKKWWTDPNLKGAPLAARTLVVGLALLAAVMLLAAIFGK